MEMYPYRNQKVEIVTLKELFEKFPNMYINIDIKDSPETYEGSLMPSKLWRLIEEYNAENRVVVTSFYSEQVDRFNLYAQNRVAFRSWRIGCPKSVCSIYKPIWSSLSSKSGCFSNPNKVWKIFFRLTEIYRLFKQFKYPCALLGN